MIALRGTIKNGQVVLDQPADLPDDTTVIVTTEAALLENDGPMTSKEIARALEAFDTIEPLDRSNTERATIEADRQAHRGWEKTQFAEQAELLQRFLE